MFSPSAVAKAFVHPPSAASAALADSASSMLTPKPVVKASDAMAKHFDQALGNDDSRCAEISMSIARVTASPNPQGFAAQHLGDGDPYVPYGPYDRNIDGYDPYDGSRAIDRFDASVYQTLPTHDRRASLEAEYRRLGCH